MTEGTFSFWKHRQTSHVVLVSLLVGLGLAVLYFRLDPARYPFPRCPVHWLTGLHCPGCGTQRAMHALLHGRFLEAIGFNVLAALVAPLVVLGVATEVRGWLGGTPHRSLLLYRPWLGWGVVGLTVVFTVLRNLPGPLGAWLAP